MNLSQQGFFIRVFTWKINEVRVLVGVFKLLRKLLYLKFFRVELLLKGEDILGENGHIRHLLVNNVELAHTLLQLKLNHADLLLLFANLLFAVL